ncbi:hypothetical protein GCM10017786_04990 [Amycolatopsis deserti]|uniref:Uncharacterized protein n=1 Tax=Amycolatopsis deserti TaxID=185696 RepID=A0ABQ3IEU6_9PSEU|nr:DUF5829 family protein [Amycolatopsis deserti]GHE78345.1 hypothetical protein GCM10017786_04990 [Amycolatopsis deserti]
MITQLRIRRTITALTLAVTGAAMAVPAAQADEDGRVPQLLFYNHAYAVVDRQTADAVEHSAYLRDFASFEVRTTTGGGVTWTGRYLKGRETYLELFGVGDLPGTDGQFGSAGTAVSTEHAGDLGTVRQRLQDQGVTPVDYRQTRDFGDGAPVPWFDTVRAAPAYQAYDGWAMEYLPEYFADPRSNTEPASSPDDVSRERYLPDDYQNHLMRDVAAIRIGVTAADLAITVPVLKAGGFKVVTLSDGSVVASGGGTTIRYDVVPRERAGLKQVVFTLNRSVPLHVEQIGQSNLVVGPGSIAVWTFTGTA